MCLTLKLRVMNWILPIIIFCLMPTTIIAEEKFSVSFQELKLGENERVAGFQIRIREGYVCSVPNLPIGWDFRVVNEMSWTARITGAGILATTFLESDWFKDFLTIERRYKEKFDVEAEVETYTTVSEKRRTIHLKMKDLLLKPQKK